MSPAAITFLLPGVYSGISFIKALLVLGFLSFAPPKILCFTLLPERHFYRGQNSRLKSLLQNADNIPLTLASIIPVPQLPAS